MTNITAQNHSMPMFWLFRLLTVLLSYDAVNMNVAITVARIINKFAYCFTDLIRHGIIHSDLTAIIASYWRTVMDFYICCPDDMFNVHADKLFLSCKKYLIYSGLNVNEPASLRCIGYRDLSFTQTIMYSFIVKDWGLFEQCLRMRRRHAITKENDVFDKICNDKKQRDYFFSSKCHSRRYERMVLVRKIGLPRVLNHNKTKNMKIFQSEKNMTIVGNVAMCKECNWNQCNRKDVTLKRCKKCRSVYYCSKTCQKKDWLSHKHVCKKSRLRDYSITFGSFW